MIIHSRFPSNPPTKNNYLFFWYNLQPTTTHHNNKRKMIVTTDTPNTEQNHKRNNHHNHNNNLCDSSHHQSPRSTSTMATTVVTEEEYIRQGCCHHNMNCRIDGRQLHEYRHYTITTTTPPNITAISSSSSSSSPLLLLPYSSTAYSYGSSELYDTMTNGTLLHLICHIKAEFTTVSSTLSTTPLVEISLFSNTTSSDSHKILNEYETSLQQYYVPCLRQSLEQILRFQPSSESSSVPTNTLWKLHVDVQVVSSIHTMSTTTLTSTNTTNNTSNTTTTSTTSTTTNSVYYLDAVTHVINAALYHTTIPLSSSSSSNTTMMEHMANDSQPLIPRKSGSQPHDPHDPVIVLPIIVTTHIMSIGNRPDPSSTTTTTALIADASSEEANLSNVAVHMVIVPTLEYNSRNNNNNTPPQRYRTNTTTSSVSALWNTKAGTISHRTMMQCMMTTLETFAPQAYRSYHHQ